VRRQWVGKKEELDKEVDGVQVGGSTQGRVQVRAGRSPGPEVLRSRSALIPWRVRMGEALMAFKDQGMVVS